MRVIEMTAKTPEEARELALKELDAAPEEVEIDVISRGKSGILGIGGEPARVRVTLLDKPTDLVKITSGILEDLVSKMGVEAVVNLKRANQEDVGGPVFDIDGEDAGLLIGRRGETLRALQFLVRLMASRRLESRVSLLLDVAGYQEKRNQAVTSLAHRVAERVVSSRRSITLEPMPPNERRVVHVALADHADVHTVSIGDGDSRQVVVEPAEG